MATIDTKSLRNVALLGHGGCGKTSIAHKGLLLAAKVLAATTADLMENPQILQQAGQEFAIATAQGYDCPIGKEVTF